MNCCELTVASKVALSEDQEILAGFNGSKITVKRIRDETTISVHDSPLPGMSLMELNFDGSLLATANKRNQLTVLETSSMATVCTLEDCCSISELAWLQSGHQLAIFSQLGLKASLLDLDTRQIVHLKSPKSTNGKNYALAHKYPFMAVLQKDGKDHVRIYHTTQLKLVNSIPLEGLDAGDIRWSPDDSTIVVSESLAGSKVLAIDPAFGVRGQFESSMTGALSNRAVAFSEDSAYLFCGGFDDHVRVINKLIFKPVAELEVGPSAYQRQAHDIYLYRE